MKKLLILLTILLLFALIGCQSSGTNDIISTGGDEELSTGNTDSSSVAESMRIPSDVERGMKIAFLNEYVKENGYTEKDLSIEYYGEYEGTHIGFINGFFDYSDAIEHEMVGLVEFIYSSSQKLLVYKDGDLLELKEAYEEGWLSEEALKQLLEYYKTVKPYLFEE